jgi:hypothetical protein
MPGAAPPATARDAYRRFVGGELREPQQLRIQRDGQFWRVIGTAMTDAEKNEQVTGGDVER